MRASPICLHDQMWPSPPFFVDAKSFRRHCGDVCRSFELKLYVAQFTLICHILSKESAENTSSLKHYSTPKTTTGFRDTGRPAANRRPTHLDEGFVSRTIRNAQIRFEKEEYSPPNSCESKFLRKTIPGIFMRNKIESDPDNFAETL